MRRRAPYAGARTQSKTAERMSCYLDLPAPAAPLPRPGVSDMPAARMVMALGLQLDVRTPERR